MADNIKAGGRERRVVTTTTLKSIGISLFFLSVLLRNVHITKRIDSSDQISNKAIVEKASYTQPVEKIVLIGERHSGTNWITDHLTECFQFDRIKVCEMCKTFLVHLDIDSSSCYSYLYTLYLRHRR